MGYGDFYLVKICVDFKEQNKDKIITLFEKRFGDEGFLTKVSNVSMELETKVLQLDVVDVSDDFIKELKKLSHFIMVGFYELMEYEGFVWDKKDKS